MAIKISKKKRRIGLLCLACRIAMDYYYLRHVAPFWSYAGLTSDFSWEKTILSYLLCAILFFFLNWDENEIFSNVLQSMYVVIIMPLLSFYGLSNKQTSFALVCSIGFLITVLMVNRSAKKRTTVSLGQLSALKNMDYLATGLLIFTVVYMIRTYGIHLNVMDILNPLVYDLRREQSSIQLGGLLGYLVVWSYKIICPLLLAMSLSKGKKILSAFYILLQILMYLSSPHKEILYSIVLVVGTYYASKKDVFSYGLVGSITGLLIIDSFTIKNGIGNIISATLRRLLFYPAAIKYEHFTYFSEHDKLYFSEGIIGRLFGINYQYGSMSTGNVIANYFHGSMSNSNTGYLAYAYDDLGFIGIILASILLAFIIIILQRIVTDKNKLFIISAAIYPFIELNDLSLLTMILTGGLAVLIIVAILLEIKPKKESAMLKEHSSDTG